MAIIDSLLKLVAVRSAEALVVQSEQVPHLAKGSEQLELSMPPLGSDLINTILDQISNGDCPAGWNRKDTRHTHYSSPDGTRFDVQIESTPEGHRMTFQSTLEQEPQRAPVERHPRSTSDSALPSTAHSNPPATAQPQTAAPYRGSPGNIADLLTQADALDASDVLLSSNAATRIRVGGELRATEQGPLSADDILTFLEPWLSRGHTEMLDEAGSCDLTIRRKTTAATTRYRVNLFKQERGLAAAFRPIRSQVPTLEDLNLPADFHHLTRHHSGLVLMVGTAGSGKSTTLVALIEHLNRTTAKHIITLEDPIEYTYVPQGCLIHQREVGTHVADFSTGLRAALRESPDVILVGEMRDRETIAAALTAAETGHLVLSTLHSGSAAMAIDRVVDVFPEYQQQQVRYQLADVLRAVVTQILLPSRGPSLRVPAYQKLVVTPAVSTKIRENRGHQLETELQKGAAAGMVTLERSLARLVQQGALSLEVAEAVAPDPVLLTEMVQRSEPLR